MKKYLMTGVAALVLSATFVSCSHEAEGYSSQEEAKAAQYQAAFVKEFGNINPNQTWGFGSSAKAMTRADINVNGNQWETTPEVTAEEAQAVYDYVNKVKTSIPHYMETAPTDLQNYYVTQVWGGKTTDLNCIYGGVHGPSHMDNLHIAQSGTISISDAGALVGDWAHINNFNASSNVNYNGNTLVTNGGTLDFAYQSSIDSKYHNKWIIIDGQYITDSKNVNHAGKYYVCFDFISNVPVTTAFQYQWYDPHGNNGGEWKGDNMKLSGEWTAETLRASNCVVTHETYDQKEQKWFTVVSHFNNEAETTFSGFNVESANQVIEANDYYTDWIVRLVKAQSKGEGEGEGEGEGGSEETDDVTASGRIFCEDLGTIGDFDFNDVVFDAYIYESGKIKIEVLAAGGTLPISVADVDVTLGQMKNTGVGKAGTQSISIDATTAKANGWTTLKAIPVVVSHTQGANHVPVELTAEQGKAPQKFCAPINTKWAVEYVNINKAYPGFDAWVTNNAAPDWANPVEEYVYLNLSNNE